MHRVLSGHIERKEMPGLVALVCCHDDVHLETLGTLSFGDASPMKRDTIFRIASISKPVTAVAAMILVEDCKLRLDQSIEPWLPELANRRVLKSISSPLDDTVPARRAITVRDLLTSRMGFGSVMAMPDTYPIQKAIREQKIGGDGPTMPSQETGMDEWLRRLGALPWMAQPGERWMYHVSMDLLGALVARVSGKSFGRFLRERIFDPLGMKDAAFHVPPENIGRLAGSYVFNRQTNALEVFDDAANSAWRVEPAFESGGGGLVSTIDDYFAFSRMMLNKGRHGREQILSRAAASDPVLLGSNVMFTLTISESSFGPFPRIGATPTSSFLINQFGEDPQSGGRRSNRPPKTGLAGGQTRVEQQPIVMAALQQEKDAGGDRPVHEMADERWQQRRRSFDRPIAGSGEDQRQQRERTGKPPNNAVEQSPADSRGGARGFALE
jgi:CubicO group peptidase (beta-lactamase class C family)